MSRRPSRAGWSPWSGRLPRRLCDSRTTPASRLRNTLAAPSPRRRGSSSAAHRLAACRSQGCEIVVNLSRPASPNTASSHTSLAFSVSGSLSASAVCRASAVSSVRFSRPAPGRGGAVACTESACAWRRSSTTSRSICTRVCAPDRVRCCRP